MKKRKLKRGYSTADQIILMQAIRREDAAGAVAAMFDTVDPLGVEVTVTPLPNGSLISSLNNRPMGLH